MDYLLFFNQLKDDFILIAGSAVAILFILFCVFIISVKRDIKAASYTARHYRNK